MTINRLCHPIQHFFDGLQLGSYLCLLPVDKLHCEQIIELSDDFVLYPAGSLSADDLNLVWWPSYGYQEICGKNTVSEGLVSVSGDDLHWIKSAATGIDRDELFSGALIAFLVELDWDRFLKPPSHEFHLECIQRASNKAEMAMDLVRLNYCNPMVIQTFPNTAGFHGKSGFTAGLFYTVSDNEAYLISGEIVPSVLVRGLGLELDQFVCLEPVHDGQVGLIARHALRLYSNALTSSTETLKFIQLMNLIEYIASPFTYMKMADVKKQIARHVARNLGEYDNILEDFKFLTSEAGAARGPNNGLRHNIIHLGRNLEDLIGPDERTEMFLRLVSYCAIPIQDMIRFSAEDWPAIETHRTNRKKELGL
ncbi:MAG: hypothetical protein ACK46Q_00530 [Hyphomonas sp.]